MHFLLLHLLSENIPEWTFIKDANVKKLPKGHHNDASLICSIYSKSKNLAFRKEKTKSAMHVVSF